MSINLTDHEQQFADSPRGQMLIARAANQHNLSEAHKGANAMPWTDAMQASAARTLAMSEARTSVATAAFMADSARQEPILRAQRDAALAKRNEEISNAWRNGR